MFDPNDTPETTSPPVAVNTPSKEELLSRAKHAVEAGEQSMHDAAEALGVAQELHSATQREMAEAIGKSASWVNKLLKWRSSGYKDDSPFGPRTNRGRVEHAQQRAQASKPGKGGIASKPDADDAQASAAKRKAEYAEQEADAATRVSRKPRSKTCAKALTEFKIAVDVWFERMDYDARCEAAAYAKAKVEAA